LLSLTLLSACSTRYQPNAGPRLSVVMESGSLAYSRDGRTYRHGFAGSGLTEAVEGDVEAREAAEKYQSRMTSGFVLTLVGTGCLLTGMITGIESIDDDRRSDGKDALIGGTLLCGLAGMIAGAALLASAQPYQWDAINIYNDHVERRRPWWLGPTPPVPYGPPSVVPPPPPPPPLPAPTVPAPSSAPASPEPPAMDAGPALEPSTGGTTSE